MEGCLSTLIKLLILGGLFIVGLVSGYLYYMGAFDAQLLRLALDGMPKLKVEEALPLVDPNATPEAASRDPASTDRKWVRWRGSIAETRTVAQDLTQLALLTAQTPRRTVVVFVDHTRAQVDSRVGDEIEVVGWSRRTFVLSEDREGHKYPQVLAIRITKVTAPVPPAPGAADSAGGVDSEGEQVAHGGEPTPTASPSASAAAPAAPAVPAKPSVAPSAAPSPAAGKPKTP